MLFLVVYVIMQNSTIKQEEKIIAIDISGKVNICSPKEDAFEEKSFFSF